jgi:hypothetical protein
VVGERGAALVRQPRRRLLHRLARQAVDDAGVLGVLSLDEAPQPLARAQAAGVRDRVADVGTVEAGDEAPRFAQTQLGDDLLAGALVGRRGERDARHRREAFGKHLELPVLGAEVVAPL